MAHSNTREMDQVIKTWSELFMDKCSTEERLRGIPLEELAKRLAPKDRLLGLKSKAEWDEVLAAFKMSYPQEFNIETSTEIGTKQR